MARTRPYLYYDTADLPLHHLLPPHRRQDRLRRRQRLHAQALPAARLRARPHRRRRRLLPPLPRGLPQAARDAAALQHAHQIRLPLRLRPLPRPRAALLPLAHRNLRRLQSHLPRLLRRQRPAPPQLPLARADRSHARRHRPQRAANPTSSRSPAASPRSTPTSSPCSTPRRLAPSSTSWSTPTASASPRKTASPSASPPICPSSSSTSSSTHSSASPSCTSAAPTSATSARKALEKLNALNISTTLVVTVERGINDNELGAHHRLRPQAALRARRHLPARPAGRPSHAIQLHPAPPDADRSAPPHPRTNLRLRAPKTSSPSHATPTHSPWPTR